MDQQPYTREEIDRMLPAFDGSEDPRLAEIQAEHPDARPLPPLSVQECQGYFYRLAELASRRPWTLRECFLHGQLLSVFQQAVRAETLGYTGRFFVLSEDDLRRAASSL